MAIEIVDFPIKNGGFPVRDVNVYQAGALTLGFWGDNQKTKNYTRFLVDAPNAGQIQVTACKILPLASEAIHLKIAGLHVLTMATHRLLSGIIFQVANPCHKAVASEVQLQLRYHPYPNHPNLIMHPSSLVII